MAGSRHSERTRPRALVAIAVGVVFSLGVATGGWAAHDFADVPDDNPFHDEISWLAGVGVTEGFPDGGFHPADAVSRQSMAAFMQRLYNVRDDVDVASTTSYFSVPPPWGTFVAVPGLEASVTVPEGTTATIIARFSAVTRCEDDDDAGWCSVRIMANGAQMAPTMTGANFAFDTIVIGGDDFYENHSIERYLTEVGPGTYDVGVQAAQGNGGVDSYELGQASLVVEAILDPAPAP